jgi:HemY protein
MRGLFWLLAVFSLAVGLSLVTRYGDGYVLIVAPPWRVEVSLALTVLSLLAAFVLGYWMVRLVSHTLRLPAHVKAFRARRHESAGREALAGSVQSLFEGRFGRARKLAAKAHEMNSAPALAALVAARAAHRMRDDAERDVWLSRAEESPDLRQARLSTEAELLLDARRYRDARAVLLQLHDGGHRGIASQLMLLRAEQGAGNWDEVVRLAKVLEKRDAAPHEWLRQLRLNATVEGLRAKGLDAANLARHWRDIDASERRDHRVAGAAARLFMRLGGGKIAHDILRDALEHEWNAQSVVLYGECLGADAREQLQQAERWLQGHPRDAGLLLTLGRLCVHLELWGKAQNYLEASLAHQPMREAHVALARLAERLDRPESAQQHYRAAADLEVAT